MTQPLPPLEFEALPVNPQGFGLYAAATVINTGEQRRHLGGVNIRPFNCDEGFGTYSALICDPDDTPAVKAAERALPGDTFEPLVVWAADECAPDQTEAEVMARAVQTRRLHAPLLVESAFATRMLSDAPAPTSVPDLATGLGLLEEFLGEQGYNGFIHAARRWAVRAADLGVLDSRGPIMRTPLQNSWVFGGGYASTLEDTIIATGPVYIWQDTPFERVETTGSHVTPAYNNSVYAMTEQVVVVGYECAIMAITIEAP